MIEQEKKSSVPNVRAVTRALDVLNSFAGKGLQSLAEVSSQTGLDKGTTRRLLITLMGRDFISQDPTTHQYRLGRAIRELAANVEHSQDLRAIARPALEDLSAALGVTAFLSVFKEGAAVCLDRVHDMRGIEVHWWAVGGTLPLNCGGAPKLFLAYQPEDQIEHLFRGSMQQMSRKSIIDFAELRAHLNLIRRRGWECAVDDVVEGLTALAVPVMGHDGLPVCSISIAGLTPQMVRDGEPAYLKQVQQTAGRIAQQIGQGPA
ncbi:IclR family transcriptional regulator [Pseudooceanicola sp. C21-150M6]|uniref:IclR family transcriptional regulator n=1 Tax=Pseudooceanicola sp. C21-150M6 TaxID=3434355 RepID=UPI003D7F7ECC